MIRETIRRDIADVLKKLELDWSDNFSLELPSSAEHGDYSSNVALVHGKLNKRNPRDLAGEIAALLKKKRTYRKIEVAGPGFLNMTLSSRVYHRALEAMVTAKHAFGNSNSGQRQKILIEFISANPTGPLNIVSARAAAYGDTLYRIMRRAGYAPVREFYINDAGNQVDILAESIELRYRELHGEDIGEFPVEAYHGAYVAELAQQLNTVEGNKLLHIPERDRLEKMKEFALQQIHDMQIASLERFGVEFDNWVSEKALRAQGMVEEVLSFLAEAGCTYEMDDAVWFSSTKFGDEKDRVLMKTDGSFTYLVPDIAYHLSKLQRGFEILIDVLGPDHHGHVVKLMAAMRALKIEEKQLEVVFLQQVNLFLDGERVKMSKREGRIVTMNELIDDVGKDAARFFFIDRRPSTHLNFDLELARKKSSENPVYYCQYAHARIYSIQKKARREKISLKDFDTSELYRLKRSDEAALIKKMLEYPHILAGAAKYREPHRLTDYTKELAGMFHKYYQAVPIVNPKAPAMSKARLYMLNALKNLLANIFEVLGIDAPQKM
ncbi:MAG: arginine--tRNA ligase [Candidatus Cloacimonetes bacterium]|nr:arginine--tRNA ligase [Candidatus Cloacimonadota bacterium]